MQKYAIVLAGGLGKRMMSSKPKALQEIFRKPLITHVTDGLLKAGLKKNNIYVVVGHGREQMMPHIEGMNGVVQEQQLGTGHATKCCQDSFKNLPDGATMVMFADVPLYDSENMEQIFNDHKENGNHITLLTAIVPDQYGYGRIIRNESGQVTKIVEQKDATLEQQQIKEINTGIMVVNSKVLFELLKKLKPSNATGEYYLTDVIELGLAAKLKVSTLTINDHRLIAGANTKAQLAELSKMYKDISNEKHLNNGVFIEDPNTTYIDTAVKISSDVTIYPNTHLYGDCVIESGAVIGPNSILVNTKIGANTEITSSQLTDCTIGNKTTIGPFAHLRDNARVGDSCKVGNFVEIKNSTLLNETKAGHLAYLGDASLGENVNIGAGTITANYDGLNKHKTVVGDNSFIGSNSTLIAPVEIGEEAIVAAGSTVTSDVPKYSLTIARSRQTNKENYKKK